MTEHTHTHTHTHTHMEENMSTDAYVWKDYKVVEIIEENILMKNDSNSG